MFLTFFALDLEPDIIQETLILLVRQTTLYMHECLLQLNWQLCVSSYLTIFKIHTLPVITTV